MEIELANGDYKLYFKTRRACRRVEGSISKFLEVLIYDNCAKEKIRRGIMCNFVLMCYIFGNPLHEFVLIHLTKAKRNRSQGGPQEHSADLYLFQE